MISQIMKNNKPEVYELVMKNNSAKSLLKQIDSIWKRIEVMLEKDLKKALGRK
tara:strand:- start:437 stop:595 length:159 start_codon:yes stop_codon:yes gene_type:complete